MLTASLRSAAARPLISLNGVLREHPVKGSILVTAVKAGLADLLVQLALERRKELDRRRLLTFFIFGVRLCRIGRSFSPRPR
jgi:hypothetical protein